MLKSVLGALSSSIAALAPDPPEHSPVSPGAPQPVTADDEERCVQRLLCDAGADKDESPESGATPSEVAEKRAHNGCCCSAALELTDKDAEE